ncbi:hypothetical protein QQF64_019510 [Cirrhinus molitorella]|uniref:Immunoglobulin V-set domain-containing protein n=1 Tax=Cirrhinus molitorella TaxID=172907 RepID=A0ABR3LJ06_9TELE
MNIRTTDSENYRLDIFSSSSIGSEIIFYVSVHGVSAQVKKNKGESVTLDTGEIKTTNYVMMWYFNVILIAEITGEQSEICADEQCKERFKNRLQLDHQTGSLTITNINTTDTGEYKLQIIISDSRFNITRVKRFNVTVIDSGQSEATIEGMRVSVCAGICVVCTLVGSSAVGGAVVLLFKDDCCRNCRPAEQNNPPNLPDQDIPLQNIPLENQEHESDSN